MIVHITRFVFIVAGILGGLAVTDLVDWTTETGLPEYLVIVIFVLLGLSIGYVFGGILGREFASWFAKVEDRLREFAPVDIVLGTVGLIGGLLVAWLISQPLDRIEPLWLSVVTTVVLFVMCAYIGLRVAVLKRDDIAASFPRLDSAEHRGSTLAPTAPMKLLDTSAIIDGRFLDLMKLGLLEGEVRVPRFVLSELHTLSDSADDVRRARGRRGLDLLARIPEDEALVFETDYPELPDVDSKLLRLAEDARAVLVTVDYNLSKVAAVRGIRVVNLNEVATALRPAFLPGEKLRLRIVREGKEAGQGVGYLDDGTMVVVQEASDQVGADVDTEVTSVLQTSAGRMIFARLAGGTGDPGDR